MFKQILWLINNPDCKDFIHNGLWIDNEGQCMKKYECENFDCEKCVVRRETKREVELCKIESVI